MTNQRNNLPNGFTISTATKIYNEVVRLGQTKAEMARQYGVSARTIGRVCDWVAKNQGVKANVAPVATSVKQSLLNKISSGVTKGSAVEVASSGDGRPSTVKEAMAAGIDVQYIITPVSIVLNFNGDSEIVENTHGNFKAVREAVLNGEFAKAHDLMNVSRAIKTYTKGAIRIEDGELFYGELALHNNLVDRILDMMADGDEGFKGLVAFLERLLKNPSKDSVDQLWGFLKHHDISINEQGYIVAWKQVAMRNGVYVDTHTKKVPNDVGNIVEMPRWMVNDNKNETCSQGLHVAAWPYAVGFSGGYMLRVLVDPADVVSIPTDYRDMKMRCAKYIVDAVVNKDKEVITSTPVNPVHVVVGRNGEILSREAL